MVSLLCSPNIAMTLEPIDKTVALFTEPRLAATSRGKRVHWWLREYPRFVKSVKPDVILYPSGIKRGYGGSISSVVVHHNMVPFIRPTLVRRSNIRGFISAQSLRIRLTRGLRDASGVLFQSAYAQQEVIRQVGTLSRTAVVPNGIDDGFAPTASKTYEIGKIVTILYVSPIYLYKHQWNVVSAVSALRRESGLDLRLRLVGRSDPEALDLLNASILKEDAAEFTSIETEVPMTEMQRLYQSADLFVFASSAETWPITLLEAMASALPIASSDRMAMPDLLQDGGVYFDPEDPVSIAAALRSLLADENLRRDLAGRAARRAQDFTWDRSVPLLYDFVRGCI